MDDTSQDMEPMTVHEPEIVDTDGMVFASVKERAEYHDAQVKDGIQKTFKNVAEIYRNEEWRSLTRDDGTPLESMLDYCQDRFTVGLAMARRWVQGARDLYLPLQDVVVEGTTIKITTADIAELGSEGITEVVDTVTTESKDIDDPDETSKIVDSAIADAKRGKEERKRGTEERETAGEWDSDDGREFYDAPASDASGPIGTYLEEDDDGTGSWTADIPETAPRADFDDTVGAYESPDITSGTASADILAPLLSDAPLYDTDKAQAELPTELRAVVSAMVTLEQADIAKIAKTLTYAHRGIIVHSDAAHKALMRIRSMAETQPWVMKHLDSAEGAA